jgi:hypothetical protein
LAQLSAWHVTALDASADALVAQNNAKRLNLTVVLQSSWFDALIDAKFDLISDPPTSSKATGIAAGWVKAGHHFGADGQAMFGTSPAPPF